MLSAAAAAAANHAPNVLHQVGYLFRCKVDGAECHFTCANLVTMNRHLKDEHDLVATCNWEVVCLMCAAEFKSKEEYQVHNALSHYSMKRKIHPCDSCNRVFLTVRRLEIHKGRAHKVRPQVIVEEVAEEVGEEAETEEDEASSSSSNEEADQRPNDEDQELIRRLNHEEALAIAEMRLQHYWPFNSNRPGTAPPIQIFESPFVDNGNNGGQRHPRPNPAPAPPAAQQLPPYPNQGGPFAQPNPMPPQPSTSRPFAPLPFELHDRIMANMASMHQADGSAWPYIANAAPLHNPSHHVAPSAFVPVAANQLNAAMPQVHAGNHNGYLEMPERSFRPPPKKAHRLSHQQSNRGRGPYDRY